MLIYNLLLSLVKMMNIAFAYVPQATKLPTFFGIDLDYYLGIGVSGYKLLMAIFPPFQTILTAAVVYLGWRLILLGLKVFLGSRLPAHQ